MHETLTRLIYWLMTAGGGHRTEDQGREVESEGAKAEEAQRSALGQGDVGDWPPECHTLAVTIEPPPDSGAPEGCAYGPFLFRLFTARPEDARILAEWSALHARRRVMTELDIDDPADPGTGCGGLG